MAGVIRAALGEHPNLVIHAAGRVSCSGCTWTAPWSGWPTDPVEPFSDHLAEVAVAAVLEVTELVLDRWLEQPQATRAMRAIAAALAGEG